MAFVSLTKPRVIELLLVTTAPVMFLAERGLPNLWLIIATLIGGSAAAASASVFNSIFDRDIDARMARTETRPLVTGEISVKEATIFAFTLAIGSILWMGGFTNWVAAGLTAAAILLYAVFYTMILKRRTTQNIVWGGAAGCMPVFIGWSAVTGSLDWAPVALFLVVFFWTPPHYWPLAEKFSRDYADAGVPMLPVVASRGKVAGQMIMHTALMVAASLAIIPLGATGWVYGVGAAAAGLWFGFLVVRYALRVRRGLSGRALGPMVVFHGSITYLTVLFVALAIDPFVTL